MITNVRALVLGSLIVVALAFAGTAQERVDLAAPILKTSTANYVVSELILDWDNARITIQLRANNGDRLVYSYEGQTATNLMIALNKANLSTRSLNQRIFDRLIADGVIVGTVGGAPQ